MKVIVDTCIWSLALRRREVTAPEALRLLELIDEARAQLIGPVRQEILAGIRQSADFDRVNQALSSFPDLDIHTNDYVQAALFTNACRSRGVQGSATDFLICACAAERSMAIFTSDKDFERFARFLPIELFPLGAKSD